MSDLADSLFGPTGATGCALLRSFNLDFADSLEYLLGVSAPHIRFDTERADTILSRLRAGSRETPILYSLHFELVDALQASNLDTATGVISRIVSQDPAPEGISICTLGMLDAGTEAQTSIPYFCEHDSLFTYSRPMPDAAERTRSVLSGAIADLERFAPGLAAEMKALVSTVILAKGTVINPDEPAEFESVTALRAFSGVLFNAHSKASRLQCAISMIHEAAHMALFAFAPSEGVVTNSPTERYVSPLRTDARPMEGIFHQCFVLARMIYGMELLLAAAGSSEEDRDFAANFIATNIPRFQAAVETINTHASLTSQGALALEAARDYVNSLA